METSNYGSFLNRLLNSGELIEYNLHVEQRSIHSESFSSGMQLMSIKFPYAFRRYVTDMFHAPSFFHQDSDRYRNNLFGYKIGMDGDICITLFSYTIPFHKALDMVNTINIVNEASLEELIPMSRAHFSNGLSKYDTYPDNYLRINFPKIRRRNDNDPIDYSLTDIGDGKGVFNILLHYNEVEASLKRETKHNKLRGSEG